MKVIGAWMQPRVWVRISRRWQINLDQVKIVLEEKRGHLNELQPPSPATGENVLVETNISLPEPVCADLQALLGTCSTSAEIDEQHQSTPTNVVENVVEMELGLGIQVGF